MAVHVISVRRAFCLLCKELAEVVSLEDGQFATYDFITWRELSEYRASHFRKEDEDWVRTVSCEIQAPRVIRLLGYDKLPKHGVKFNRRNIFARDNNQCQYCGKRYATAELSLDHVVPRSQGGASTWDNIVCACLTCNVRKGGRTPRQAHMALVRKPEKPKRSPVLNLKLTQTKYQSWQAFLDNAYWDVELK
jgi:5-methylcytosine-specific restriction endonuclease McrA